MIGIEVINCGFLLGCTMNLYGVGAEGKKREC